MIIFDLDGTLSNCAHRRPLIDKQARGGLNIPNWRAFYAACVHDEPIAPVVDIFRMLHSLGTHLEIWSGRSDEVRGETLHWLNKHVFHYSNGWMLADSPEYVRVRMRPASSTMPDDQLKEQWLNQAQAEGLTISAVIDDRNKVCAMWRRRGIVCLQAAAGDF